MKDRVVPIYSDLNFSDVSPEQNIYLDIKPIPLNEILANKGKEETFLLSPWLPEAGLAMVYAAPGVGKTFFCLNIAIAIASGGDFLKFYAEKPSKVLYIDGEMGYNKMQPRIEMIEKIQGKTDTPENFLYLSFDQFPQKLMPKISTLEGQSIFNKIIFENDVKLVILDNLSCLTNLVENNAEDWNIMQDWEIRMRSRGISVLLVHHTSKDKKNQRGTVKREDILDTVILLEGIKEESKSIGSQFKITFTKNRGFFGSDAEPFEAFLNQDGTWNMKSDEQSIFDKVVEFSNLGMSQIEISIELGTTRSRVCRLYAKAKNLGLIKIPYKAAPRGLNKRDWLKDD